MEYVLTEQMRVGYGKHEIVQNINLHLKRGEIMTLIGPNGVGKSTILKSFTRQLSMLGGTCVLDNKELETYNDRELAKKMSIVLTGRVQGEYFTCKDIVEKGRYPYTGSFGIFSDEDHRKVMEALELVNMKDYADCLFEQLSDGQKQRVLLAKAVCQEPEILVLDEPASFLDIRYKLELAQILKHLAKEKNMAILMALHEIDLAKRISDIVVCIKDGKVDQYGEPEDIYSSDYISKLYDIKQGSYNVEGSLMELPPVKNPPEIFVIAGGGFGISVYHKLWRKQIPFAAGVLHENDIETPIAKSLASSIVLERAFEPVSEEKMMEAKKILQYCKSVICACEQFGTMNMNNKLLLNYAKEQNMLIGPNFL